jgi:hypothetical protein
MTATAIYTVDEKFSTVDPHSFSTPTAVLLTSSTEGRAGSAWHSTHIQYEWADCSTISCFAAVKEPLQVFLSHLSLLSAEV